VEHIIDAGWILNSHDVFVQTMPNERSGPIGLGLGVEHDNLDVFFFKKKSLTTLMLIETCISGEFHNA
jgi:hypothetical protein